MENSCIKKLTSRKTPSIWGYGDFYSIENKYLFGNGVLLGSDGNEIWNTPWEYRFNNAVYLRSLDCIIIDKFTIPGPISMNAGAGCTSLKDGNFL